MTAVLREKIIFSDMLYEQHTASPDFGMLVSSGLPENRQTGEVREMEPLRYMKNIPGEQVLDLAGMVEAGHGQVVSRTLAQNPAVSVTLFAFDKGEEISTHASGGDAMVTVLEGVGKFTVDGVEHLARQGQTLVMPAGKPHAVYAQEAFKMLLVVVFPPAP